MDGEKRMKMKLKAVSIPEEYVEWIGENKFNLSAFVKKKLEEEILRQAIE